jgi:hypothetical protein
MKGLWETIDPFFLWYLFLNFQFAG